MDIDGVLATDKQFYLNKQKFQTNNKWAKKLDVPYKFDDGCVKILNDILEKKNVDIILTSDWRLHWHLDEIDIIFKENGVIKSPIDKTDIVENGLSLLLNRVYEIESYLFKNDFIDKNKDLIKSNWVIVDDLKLDLYFNDVIQNRFIKTASKEGLKQTNIKQKILTFFN